VQDQQLNRQGAEDAREIRKVLGVPQPAVGNDPF
jgi:hypothetical protein